MQQQGAMRISQRRHENGGSAANNHPSCLVDRLLRPTFSMGFSNSAHKDEERFLELKTVGKGFSTKEGSIKLYDDRSNNSQEEEVDSSEIRACSKNHLNNNVENLNFMCKKRKMGSQNVVLGDTGSLQKMQSSRKSSPPMVRRTGISSLRNCKEDRVIKGFANAISGKSCRLRWYNQLDPRINKAAFTEEEEGRLIEAHIVYGNKWAFISRLFPGRTDNSVKNHWHVLMSRNHRAKLTSNKRTKWATTSQTDHIKRRSMQETACDFVSSYDGKPCSPGSTSQISFAAPISLPPTTAVDHYQDSTGFLEVTATPKFIDFLGVGNIGI